MAVRMILKHPPPVAIWATSLFAGEWANRSVEQWRRCEIRAGRDVIPLADLMHIESKDTGDRVVGANHAHAHLTGDLRNFHELAASLSAGTVTVEGSVGDRAGYAMTAGRLVIHGDAGDELGGQMTGGSIGVYRSAGDRPGGARGAQRRGMNGGTICILGSAGDGIGQRMRRGLIAVGGSAGDWAAGQMLAGTVVIAGATGAHPGAEMRRGTLVLLQPPARDLRPAFVPGGTGSLVAVELIAASLARCEPGWGTQLEKATWQIHHGDILHGGRGEILVRAP
jgi:formylmethanofuran dehydrogenase subunit C